MLSCHIICHTIKTYKTLKFYAASLFTKDHKKHTLQRYCISFLAIVCEILRRLVLFHNDQKLYNSTKYTMRMFCDTT